MKIELMKMMEDIVNDDYLEEVSLGELRSFLLHFQGMLSSVFPSEEEEEMTDEQARAFIL